MSYVKFIDNNQPIIAYLVVAVVVAGVVVDALLWWVRRRIGRDLMRSDVGARFGRRFTGHAFAGRSRSHWAGAAHPVGDGSRRQVDQLVGSQRRRVATICGGGGGGGVFHLGVRHALFAGGDQVQRSGRTTVERQVAVSGRERFHRLFRVRRSGRRSEDKVADRRQVGNDGGRHVGHALHARVAGRVTLSRRRHARRRTAVTDQSMMRFAAAAAASAASAASAAAGAAVLRRSNQHSQSRQRFNMTPFQASISIAAGTERCGPVVAGCVAAIVVSAAAATARIVTGINADVMMIQLGDARRIAGVDPARIGPYLGVGSVRR